jgi:L-methionine (R)-S-oxide reductase
MTKEPMTVTPQQAIAKELTTLAEAAAGVEELMSIIVGRLQERLNHYDWVGFYMIEKGGIGEDPVLVLGPYVGAVTQHKRIPLNQGICGAAASTGRTVIVDDVSKDPRYLACSLETKSEIVAPILVKGDVVGELDIDSHTPAAFGPDDRQLVEHCARLVGQYLEKTT